MIQKMDAKMNQMKEDIDDVRKRSQDYQGQGQQYRQKDKKKGQSRENESDREMWPSRTREVWM